MSSNSTPVKVSFYTSFPGGGIGRYTNQLMRHLNALPEVSVELMCMPEFEWRDDPGYDTWPGLFSISHRIPLIRRARFLVGQLVNPILGVRHAASVGSDVIHFADFSNLTFPVWQQIVERTDLKIAISAHDIRRQKAIICKAWEERQLKAVYRYADALFVHSGFQANELARYAGVDRRKVHVVPHGPYAYRDEARDKQALRTAFGLPVDKQIALFFGHLRDEKNLESFLRALPKTEADVHVVVAGRSASRHRDVDYYRQLAADLGITDRVHFIARFIEDAEVGSLFTASDWVALPYENAFTSQSGVLNIAAHYERPVLASSAPVVSETVRDAQIGVACDGDDAEALAAGITEMDQCLAAAASFGFDTYHLDYSWEENARRTLAVYGELLDGNGHE